MGVFIREKKGPISGNIIFREADDLAAHSEMSQESFFVKPEDEILASPVDL